MIALRGGGFSDDALSQAQAIYLDPEDLLSQRGYAVFKSGQTKRMER